MPNTDVCRAERIHRKNGAVNDDGFIMNRPLDSIESFIPLPEMKYCNYPEYIEEHFVDILGVDAEAEIILVYVSGRTAKRIDAKPIYGSQRIIKTIFDTLLRDPCPQFKDDGNFVKYGCIDNYEFRREFISFFDELFVLGLGKLREVIDDTISAMNAKYIELRTYNSG